MYVCVDNAVSYTVCKVVEMRGKLENQTGTNNNINSRNQHKHLGIVYSEARSLWCVQFWTEPLSLWVTDSTHALSVGHLYTADGHSQAGAEPAANTHLFPFFSSSLTIEESDSPSDPMIPTTEVKTQEKAPETFSLVSQTAPKSQSPSLELKSTPTLPLYAKVSDASSGDSGDSEIELVSEEPSPQAPSSAYMTFSKSPSTPPPAPATTQAPVSVSVPAFNPLPGLASAPNSAAMQYSILREEREAELDSELALESCEEESPKRFPQDSSTKVSKVNSQPDEPPPPSATVIAAPPVNPAPPPAAPVSDDAPKEKMASEGEDEKTKPSIKPSPPTAVLPELKVEQPPEERQAERKHSSAERHPTTPAIFQGITREKGKALWN